MNFGWVRTTAERTWPWTKLLLVPDMVTVSSAYLGSIDWLRPGEDEFRRQFRTIANDPETARRLADPALQAAHVRGEIHPWTLVDDQLFTVVPDAAVTPTAIASATRRTMRIVELLHLRSGVAETTDVIDAMCE